MITTLAAVAQRRHTITQALYLQLAHPARAIFSRFIDTTSRLSRPVMTGSGRGSPAGAWAGAPAGRYSEGVSGNWRHVGAGSM